MPAISRASESFTSSSVSLCPSRSKSLLPTVKFLPLSRYWASLICKKDTKGGRREPDQRLQRSPDLPGSRLRRRPDGQEDDRGLRAGTAVILLNAGSPIRAVRFSFAILRKVLFLRMRFLAQTQKVRTAVETGRAFLIYSRKHAIVTETKRYRRQTLK